MTPSFEAFRDEMVKIALFRRLAKGFTNAVSEGWHGTGPEGSDTRNYWTGRGSTDAAPSYDPNKWGGKHMPIDPRSVAAGHRFRPTAGRRAWNQFTSLGGLTKALPLGAKSMMAVPTVLMARQALKAEDPSGMQRSRTERLTGLAANTVGGLAGSSLAMTALRGRGGFWGGMAGQMVGGLVGGSLAEKAVTTPFRAARAHRMGMAQPQQPQLQQPMANPQNPGVQPSGVPA